MQAFPETQYKPDPSVMMNAAAWFGSKDVRIVKVPKPMITEETDAILRVTTAAICGSDLHLYHNEFAGMQEGDILGHEFMGVIESIGPKVQNVKVGDRVVIAFPISCGTCEYCKKGRSSACDRTNPSKQMEQTYGHRCAGMFGYSHLTGGYPGGQAEFVRIPFADNACLKVPDDLSDEQVLFLGDIASTAWYGNELAKVKPGKVVGIWGAGPVGILACLWAKFRGAARVVLIDNLDYRLDFAKDRLQVETINFDKQDVIQTVHNLVPGGFDSCIDCAGFRFTKSLIHKVERALKLETDSPTALNEMINLTKKVGHIGVVADYYGKCNHFDIGAFMEKGLRMGSGQTAVQRYWTQLLQYLQQDKIDLSFIITHRLPLEQASEGYKIFDERSENCIKVILKPGLKTSST